MGVIACRAGTESNRHRLTLFGAGRWGRHYLRLLPVLGADVVICCTRRTEGVLPWLAEDHPTVTHTTDLRAALAAEVDGVVIATPRETHAPLAMAALRHGLHVLVEKPAALSIPALLQLLVEAQRRDVALMTGYTHCFDSSFRALCQMAAGSAAINWCLEWHNPAPATGVQDVVWEYFPHVFSMALLLAGTGHVQPAQVSRTIVRDVGPRSIAVEATVHVGAMSGCVHVSTAAPQRHKQLVLRNGDAVLASWTDRRLHVLDTGTVLRADEEPLARQIQSFLSAMGPARQASRVAEHPSDLRITKLLVELAKDLGTTERTG